MEKTDYAIFTNMCMVTDGKGNVLVQDRTDPGWPGITFPGGHVEPWEAFSDAVIREVREETGITVAAPSLCGIKHFYTREGWHYIVLLYKADSFTGTPKGSPEGAAFWMPMADLPNARLVPDFGSLLKVFLHDEISELYYTPPDMGEETRFY